MRTALNATMTPTQRASMTIQNALKYYCPLLQSIQTNDIQDGIVSLVVFVIPWTTAS